MPTIDGVWSAEAVSYGCIRADGHERRDKERGVYNPVETLGLGMEYLIAEDKGDKGSAAAQRSRRVNVYLVR